MRRVILIIAACFVAFIVAGLGALAIFGHNTPGITGQSLAAAKAQVEAVDLKLTVDGVGGQQVCRQVPEPGYRLWPGDEVTAFVGSSCTDRTERGRDGASTTQSRQGASASPRLGPSAKRQVRTTFKAWFGAGRRGDERRYCSLQSDAMLQRGVEAGVLSQHPSPTASCQERFAEPDATLPSETEITNVRIALKGNKATVQATAAHHDLRGTLVYEKERWMMLTVTAERSDDSPSTARTHSEFDKPLKPPYVEQIDEHYCRTQDLHKDSGASAIDIYATHLRCKDAVRFFVDPLLRCESSREKSERSCDPFIRRLVRCDRTRSSGQDVGRSFSVVCKRHDGASVFFILFTPSY